MAKHRRQASRANGTKIVGVAGLAAAAATLALTTGAGTAQAKPHGFGFGGFGGNDSSSDGTSTASAKPRGLFSAFNQSSSPAAAASAAATPPTGTVTGIAIPHYGNIPSQLTTTDQAGNNAFCPGGKCYNSRATTILPVQGNTVPDPNNPGHTTTVPATANQDFPVVSSADGTKTTIQLPTFQHSTG